MTTRRATPADIPEIVRVINLAYQVEVTMFHGERTSEPEVSERLGCPTGTFLVVDDTTANAEPRLAGAVYVETGDERGYFGMLSVDPTHQGRGLGRALVAAAEAHCRNAGCRVLDIDVVDLRTELPPFYTALGFTVTGQTAFPDPTRTKLPVRLIRMEKPLDD